MRTLSASNMAESTNLFLQSLNWSTLLKETSEDSCDSDETIFDGIDNATKENNLQHCRQNSSNTKELTSIDEGNTNISDQNIQYELEKDLKVNNETHINQSYESSFNFIDSTKPVNNNASGGNGQKHQFESDFGFTDLTEMSSLKDIHTCLSNTMIQKTNDCSNNSTLLTGFNCSKPGELGLNHCFILENDENQSKTSDSDLNMCVEPLDICSENTLQLATGENLYSEEISLINVQCMVPTDLEKDGILDELIPNLDHIMKGSFVDNLIRCSEYPKRKPCSPPLTLNEGTRRKILPADKVLPNYRKNNSQSENKKLLPARNCSSAFIDLSNRKYQRDESTRIIIDSDEFETLGPKTDFEAQDDNSQIQTRKENHTKQYEIKARQLKCNKKVKQHFPNKVKRSRKKKCVPSRMKQGTKANTSESVCQDKGQKGIDETLQEIKTNLEHLEERAARWISGADENPPTREIAFKMLGDTQTYITTLQQLKSRHESRRKLTQKCEQKLIKLLLIRSKQLEITIDKAIAAADRLMDMELNEMLVLVGLTKKRVKQE